MSGLTELKLLAKRPERFSSRNRIIEALDEQIASARAMLAGESHVPMRSRWITLENGEKVRKDMPVRQRHWFWREGDVWFLTIRHGARILAIREGKGVIEIGDKADLVPTMEVVRGALVRGELDNAIRTSSEGVAKGRKPKAVSSKAAK
jgi:hypothetical protein